MKHPDPKKHQLISFAKSGIRIVASVAAALAVASHIQLAIILLAIGYAAAEVVGVYEELV
jgi:hydrogenase maturation factor